MPARPGAPTRPPTPFLRTAAVYTVLVGLPLGGLLSILHYGAQLTAPAVVAGSWQLASSAEAGECLGLAPGAPLSIEQSGRFLRLTAGEASVDGRIDADRMRVDFAAEHGACAGADVRLEARIERDVLAGSVRAPGCAACADATFHADRIISPSP